MTDDEQRLRDLLQQITPFAGPIAFDALADQAGHRPRRQAITYPVVAALAVVVLAIGVAVIGHSGHRSATPATPAPFSSAAPVLPTELAQNVPCPTKPDTPVNSAALHAFRAVAAVYCQAEPRDYPGDGEWLVQIHRAATINVAVELQSAYESSNAPLGGVGACNAVGYVDPVATLIAADGSTLVPTPPHDGCGAPSSTVRDLINGSGWTEIVVDKLTHDLTQAQVDLVDAGCPINYKNLTDVADYPAGRLASGGTVFPVTPTTVRICYYHMNGTDHSVGTVTRTVVLTPAQTSSLLPALSLRGSPVSCTAGPAFAVVNAPNGASVEVDLGPCARVYRDDGMGQANPTVIKSILGSG